MKTLTLSFALFLSFCVFDIEAQNSGTFVDSRDNQQYKWVKIGNQTWMAENLNYSGGYHVNYNETTKGAHGRIYVWRMALKACPPGWHLPSDEEWKELEKYLGMVEKNIDLFSDNRYTEGAWLRRTSELKSTSGWMDNGNGDNRTGFSAYPDKYENDTKGYTIRGGQTAIFWSSTSNKNVEQSAFTRKLTYFNNGIGRGAHDKTWKISVRCVKD